MYDKSKHLTSGLTNTCRGKASSYCRNDKFIFVIINIGRIAYALGFCCCVQTREPYSAAPSSEWQALLRTFCWWTSSYVSPSSGLKGLLVRPFVLAYPLTANAAMYISLFVLPGGNVSACITKTSTSADDLLTCLGGLNMRSSSVMCMYGCCIHSTTRIAT